LVLPEVATEVNELTQTQSKKITTQQMRTRQEKIEALGRVIDVLERLRVDCPWDRKQTNLSLRSNTIEEVYELADALLEDDTPNIRKELGDVLLHVLFYSKIGEEKGQFDIVDVCDALNTKLIYRHPHVFGDVEAKDAETVLQNWEALKLKEKDGNKTALSGVPTSLPAMIKAQRVQEKTAALGFDWSDRKEVWNKVREELDEFASAAEQKSADEMEAEMGDVLFSLINVARHYDINAETALERTNKKFISRFNYIERKANEQGTPVNTLTLEQMDALWNEAKAEEKAKK
jgi:XTP/dITP diphosphohydrolase